MSSKGEKEGPNGSKKVSSGRVPNSYITTWLPKVCGTPLAGKNVTKYFNFRFPDLPIPFSGAEFRAGSIFEV